MTSEERQRRPDISTQFEQFARPADQSDRKWTGNKTIDLKANYQTTRRKGSHKEIERRLSKVLHKKDTLVEQHVKYFSRHETSKKSQSPEKPASRRHNMSLNQQIGTTSEQLPMSFLERQHMLNTLSRGYQIFKDLSVNEQKPRPRRLDPLALISRTLVADSYHKESLSSPDKRLGPEELIQLQQQKQLGAGAVNPKLDKTIEKDGKVLPLRLLLSNKVRSKLVRDLISEDQEKVRENIGKIIASTDDEHWVQQFTDIQNNLRATEQTAKQRHHHQLVSRSNYTNAYYQYLALGKQQKLQYKRKG